MTFTFLCNDGTWIPSHLSFSDRLRLLKLRLRNKAPKRACTPWIRAFICPECAAVRASTDMLLNSLTPVCPYCASQGKTRLAAVRVYGRLSLFGGRFLVREYEESENRGVLISIFGNAISEQTADEDSPSAPVSSFGMAEDTGEDDESAAPVSSFGSAKDAGDDEPLDLGKAEKVENG